MSTRKHPYIAFDKPVAPPPVESDGLFCWEFDGKWVPYILTLLKTLAIPRTYTGDQVRACGEARNLINSLISEGDCFPNAGTDCVDFPTTSPIFEWQPQNPITEPEYIPPGYIAVPWLYVDEGFALEVLGIAQVGDVITGYLSLPILTPAIGEGIARFRLNLNGTGTVELHLIQIPHGGAVGIVVDDNILGASYIEINKDLLQAPPETTAVLIHEVEITEPGLHHIDVTFLPRFNDELVFVAYGGGIRKVVLCGFEEMGYLMDVRQNEEEPCKLEKSIDGVVWTEFADLQQCPPILRRVGNTFQYGIPDEEGVTFFTFPEADETVHGESEPQWPPEDVPAGESGACLAAENIVAMLQSEVIEWTTALESGFGALLLATIVTGALAAALIAPFMTPAIVAFATGIVGIGLSGLSEFTPTVYDRLKCILFCHASSDGAFTVDEYEDVLADIDEESGTAWDIIRQWVDFRGAVGLTRMAAAAGIEDGDCASCDCGTVYTITANHGNSSESTVMDGDEFTISSTLFNDNGTGDFASCHLVNHYIEFTISPPVKLEIISISGRESSCVYGSSNAEWGIWSSYPSTRWYTSNSTPSGVFANVCALLALWNDEPGVSITFKVRE